MDAEAARRRTPTASAEAGQGFGGLADSSQVRSDVAGERPLARSGPAARHGAVTGLFTAGQLLADPGRKLVDVDGVAAVTLVRPATKGGIRKWYPLIPMPAVLQSEPDSERSL